MTPLGREIKRLREDKGLSQEALADVAGLTQGAVGHIESGRTKVLKSDVLYRLCDALGVTCDHFRGFTPQPAPKKRKPKPTE
jgi:transcriptional regulator with XRE-family HTH domain